MNGYLSLGFFLLVVLAAAAVGGSFEAGYWYQDLNKPPWAPPDWIYGPALALTYVLMAMAAWKVWSSGNSMRLGAIVWWFLVLVLNTLWYWLIFGLHRPGWAMFLSAAIVAIALMCCRAFFLMSRPAGAMVAPFILWSVYVTGLGYGFWTMNGGSFGGILG